MPGDFVRLVRRRIEARLRREVVHQVHLEAAPRCRSIRHSHFVVLAFDDLAVDLRHELRHRYHVSARR